MKKTFDKHGRTLYKFSHSVMQGGWLYVRKTIKDTNIQNKQGLRNVLEALSKKYDLFDVTIKVYDTIFFLFFQLPKTLAPAALIESIHKNIAPFADWDNNHVFTGVYDLQEKFIRKDLEKWGYAYEKG